jgi:hypothetical protein
VLFIDDNQQPNEAGRPLLMDPTAQLGFYLFFIGSTMGTKHLCLIFSITPSVSSQTITAMLSLVAQKLKTHPFARVTFPNVDKIASFSRQINLCEPDVDDVIGFMDGLLLHLSALWSQWIRTLCTMVTIGIQRSITYPMAQMAKCFLCH